MKPFFLAFIVLLLVVAAPAARAQLVSAQTVSACGTPNNSPVVPGTYPLTMDRTGALCTAGQGGGSIGSANAPFDQGSGATTANTLRTTDNQGQPNAGGALAWWTQNAVTSTQVSFPSGTNAALSIATLSGAATVDVFTGVSPGVNYYFQFQPTGGVIGTVAAAQINGGLYATSVPITLANPTLASSGQFRMNFAGPGTLYIVPIGTTTTTSALVVQTTSASISLPNQFTSSAAVPEAAANFGIAPGTSFGAACYVAKAAPGNLYALTYDTTATSGYTVAYNLSAVPTTGTTGISTLWFAANKAAGTSAMAAAIVPYYASVGVVICQTAATVPTTYTTGTASNFSAQVQ